MKFLTALVAIFVSISASTVFAKDMPLIELKGEGCSVTIPLGLQISNDNPRVIEGIYFNDDDGKRHFFSKATLREMTVVYTESGYDVASLELKQTSNANVLTLTVEYLRSAIAVMNRHKEIEFNVVYNAHLSRYEVINPSNNRAVTQAYVVPTKRFGKMVGISSITFQ
ncbi:MAG: hypothetical protein JST80_09770 [Bdellovibrionales bacterium]|nr:hypothetical protein [Bdellovibrionales bacterium]